jgi:chemotaxis protein CheD
MKHIIGVADMCVSGDSGDEIVTHALGSCLGISVHDQLNQIGGMLHVMLPTSTINPEKAQENPCMFVDTGVPALLRQVHEAGGVKNQLSIKVAGGASKQTDGADRFAIGKRNYLMLRKVLWKYGLLIEGEDIGGESPRTMYLEIGTGQVRLTSMGQEIDL